MRIPSRACHYQYCIWRVKLTYTFAGGTRLGAYFSVYLTGEDSDPDSDPPPQSSTTSNTSTGQ